MYRNFFAKNMPIDRALAQAYEAGLHIAHANILFQKATVKCKAVFFVTWPSTSYRVLTHDNLPYVHDNYKLPFINHETPGQ